MFRRRYENRDVIDSLLTIPGLHEMCRDYLRYIDGMASNYNPAIRHQFDSQRQVTHNQLLAAIGKTRSDNIDMAVFARRYLAQEDKYPDGVYYDYEG